jgi:hypothetical protein
VTNRRKLGQEERHGGHVEAMLFSWRTKTACVFINADAITGDMSTEEAKKMVIDFPWPDDNRDQVSHAAIAVRSNEHFYLLSKGDKGVFELGEEYDGGAGPHQVAN